MRAVVEGVLFDLFETLITESETRPAGVSSLAPRLGMEPVAFREQWKLRRAAVTLGRLSFVQAVAEIGGALGSPVDAQQLEALRRERVSSKAAPLARTEASILRLLDELRLRGTRIGVVSNCFAEDVATWSESLLARRVHAAVFSFEVGLAKPDPEIYREASRRLGIRPEDMMFIGDGADNELTGATQAGLRAFKALWFLGRWPHFQRDEMETGLQCVEDVARLVA